MPNDRPTTPRRSPWHRRAPAIAVAPVLAAAFAAPAFAQEPPPDPGSSAVDQYVELVPTGRGPKSPGVEKERKAPLTKKAKRALDKAPKTTADALTTVATSSDYGAPSTPPSPTPAKPKPRESKPRDSKPLVTPRPGGSIAAPTDAPTPAKQPSLNRTLQATAAAAAPVDDARIIALLGIVVATAIAGGALAARRRRL